MEPKKESVVVNLNGEQIPFMVVKSDERFFREAKDILNDRLASLTSDYAAHASANQLVSALAIEASVEALKINERYQMLKSEVQTRLENIQTRFED